VSKFLKEWGLICRQSQKLKSVHFTLNPSRRRLLYAGIAEIRAYLYTLVDNNGGKKDLCAFLNRYGRNADYFEDIYPQSQTIDSKWQNYSKIAL
jgi:hypothetical protein